MSLLNSDRVIRFPLVWIALAFSLANLLALAIWGARGLYAPTGDEPHYLIISDALWSFGGSDVSAAYLKEFAQPDLYPLGLAPVGSPMTSEFAHVVTRGSGVFSWHGPLLGWLLAVPLGLFGILGAKLVMVALGLIGVAATWKISGVIFSRDQHGARFVSVLVLVLTYPILLASTQIFPDLLAGSVVLWGLYWILSALRRVERPWWAIASMSSLVSTLPWLGFKYSPTAVVLVVVAGLLEFRVAGVRRLAPSFIPLITSGLLMLWYQVYAFGSPLGAWADGVVEYGPNFWIRLTGLALDQDQGFLFYNPMLWLGLAFFLVMLRRYPLFGLTWVAAFLSLWIPGAAHPGWYGGGSFVGRYGWPLAMMMIIPTLFGLQWLWTHSRKLFTFALIASALFSLWVFTLHVFIGGTYPGGPAGLDLYTKQSGTWLESYSVFYFPLENFFPAFYDPDWVWSFGVNWVWIALVVAVLLVVHRKFLALPTIAIFGVGIVIAGLISTPGERYLSVEAGVSSSGMPAAGYIFGGPTQLMRQGPYTWGVEYMSTLAPNEVAGKWELVRDVDAAVVASGELPGTGGEVTQVGVPVPFRSLEPMAFTYRLAWYGSGGMSIDRTFVSHGGIRQD